MSENETANTNDGSGLLPVPVSNRQIRETYNRVARVYAHTVARLEAPSQHRALAEMELSPGDLAVDVGCGPGRLLPTLADRVGPAGAVVGLDAAPAMLSQADRVARAAGVTGRLSLTVGDARRLPLPDGAADAVCVFDVLDLFARPTLHTVLTECRRILGADGQLCVVTMDRASVPGSSFLRAYEWAYRRLPGFAAVGCRPIPASAALRETGFEIESVTRLRRATVWPVSSFVCTPDTAACE